MSELRGIDVSSWQHPGGQSIDWWACWDAGYRFALVKATQGSTYVNPWLVTDLADARAAGFLVGAYHFVEAGVDGASQGAHFIAALLGQRLELGAWIDWEPPELPTWEASALYNGIAETVWETRHDAGTYSTLAYLDELAKSNCRVLRRWVADWTSEMPQPAPFLWQSEGGAVVPGVPAPCDVDVLTTTRAVNLLTGPAPKQVAALAPAQAGPAPEPVSEVSEPAETAPESQEPAPAP